MQLFLSRLVCSEPEVSGLMTRLWWAKPGRTCTSLRHIYWIDSPLLELSLPFRCYQATHILDKMIDHWWKLLFVFHLDLCLNFMAQFNSILVRVSKIHWWKVWELGSMWLLVKFTVFVSLSRMLVETIESFQYRHFVHSFEHNSPVNIYSCINCMCLVI